jgi:hypothetical protein
MRSYFLNGWGYVKFPRFKVDLCVSEQVACLLLVLEGDEAVALGHTGAVLDDFDGSHFAVAGEEFFHLGFGRLTGQAAHEHPVRDPGAVLGGVVVRGHARGRRRGGGRSLDRTVRRRSLQSTQAKWSNICPSCRQTVEKMYSNTSVTRRDFFSFFFTHTSRCHYYAISHFPALIMLFSASSIKLVGHAKKKRGY